MSLINAKPVQYLTFWRGMILSVLWDFNFYAKHEHGVIVTLYRLASLLVFRT